MTPWGSRFNPMLPPDNTDPGETDQANHTYWSDHSETMPDLNDPAADNGDNLHTEQPARPVLFQPSQPPPPDILPESDLTPEDDATLPLPSVSLLEQQPQNEHIEDAEYNIPDEQNVIVEQYLAATLDGLDVLMEKMGGIEKQLSRLAKEQFKANTLTEEALSSLRTSTSSPRPFSLASSERLSPAAQFRAPTAPASGNSAAGQTQMPQTLRLLEAFMPILDSIEAGLASGRVQLMQIGDMQARETLAAWLEGQRLLRNRVLALFEKENVRAIDAIGQLFDPYRHVAVQTVYDPARPTGTIVEVHRTGYETDQQVLRFAEVVVTTNRA